jgi:16S rRNA (uracil1498-N3)-methyltransferase
MHRFFVDDQGIHNGFAYLESSEARHALKVLRLEKGDEVVLMDGQALYRAALYAISGELVRCEIIQALPSPEASLRITLYQGLPKADKLEWIVQKCTEAGAANFVPIALSRCVSVVTDKDAAKKQERWQRIVQEAAKQSGRAAIPAVSLPLSFAKAFERLKSHELVLVPWEEAGGFGPYKVHEQFSHVRDIAIVIGPEGGIAPEEITRLKSIGAIPMTLGKRILRTETAGLAAAVALFALWGDME